MDLPLLYGKANDKAVINPGDQIRYDELHDEEQGGRRPPYPRDCILYFYGELLDEAKKKYPVRLMEKYWWGSLHVIESDSATVGMVRSGMGDSFAGLVLELLIAKGVRNVIAVGAAGGIQQNCRMGDIILVTKAIRAEGVSYHYEPARRYSMPSLQLNRRLEKALVGIGASYRKGVTWTNSAPFRETLGEVRRFQKEGVLSVEMEAAALFSIAKFRKMRLSSLLFISDNVSGPKWNPQFHSTGYAEGRNLALQAAVKAFW